MGGGGSKPDNYVLRFASDSGSVGKSTKVQATTTSPNTSTRKRSSKLSIEEADSIRQELTRTKSSKVIPIEKEPPPGAFISRSPSSRSFKGSSGNGKCSNYFPWLLKNAKLNGSSLKDFEFGPKIGQGYSGTVRMVRYKQEKYCVFKAIRKDALKNRDIRHVRGEKEVLSKINSPFCIKMFSTFQDKSYLYFALEFAPGGELFHRLGRKQFFKPDTAKFYATEVFVAIDHVQSLGYVYRDLKPENILIDEEGHCKLVDFGFSTSANSQGMLHTLCGTPAYLAPEILDGKFTNGYTKIVDWWSFGILIYELLTGKTPFSKSNKESPYEIFLKILQNKIWFPIGFDPKSKELVSSLTHPQVQKRLCEAEKIRKHGYFVMDWNMVEARKLVPPFVPKLKTPGDTYYFNNRKNEYRPATGEQLDAVSSYEFADF